MKLRLLYHIAFWAAFSLLFVFQNPDADYEDYLAWFVILGVAALAVYVNLLYLLPKYFFKKDYIKYTFFLILLVVFGGLLLKSLIVSNNDNLNVSFLQQSVNLFFFVVISSSFKFFHEFLIKQKRLIKIENQQLKTELALLKSQVNPHFLFNTLNNMYGLIIQNQNQQAAAVTLKLSDLMRYLLESSKADRVSLKREVQFVEDYLDLEKIRLAQQADIRFEVSDFENDISVAPLLLIPLVENAFKHGLQSLTKGCFAHFSLAVQDGELFFEAKNSIGKAITNQNRSQTGLDNLRKRLELLYPEKHVLEIENKGDIFKVTLNIGFIHEPAKKSNI